MMVYVVQNYLAYFGLCPSSGMWKFYKRPQRFRDWICLSLGGWGRVDLLSWARQKELVSITGPVSETLWSFVKLPHTR
jgi:hypothetical protein